MYRSFSLAIVSLITPGIAFAYTSPIVVPESPRTVLPLGEVVVSQEYFGALDDFPHTYSFEVREPQPYQVYVAIPDEPHYKNDVSLIVVKTEKKGVTEIGRTSIKDASWERERSVLYAEDFRVGGTLSGTLEPGKYILEVSAPNNDAKYRLYWGTASVDRGYFGNVRALFAVKSFLGHSWFGTLFSPLLYVPLCILIIVLGILYYRKRRVS